MLLLFGVNEVYFGYFGFSALVNDGLELLSELFFIESLEFVIDNDDELEWLLSM